MSGPQQGAPGPAPLPEQQRPKSLLEDMVLALRAAWSKYRAGDPDAEPIEDFVATVDDLIRHEVTEQDRRTFRPIRTAGERAAATFAAEPYRTRLRRIRTMIHDSRERDRRMRSAQLPVWESAVTSCIEDLWGLVNARRRVS